jgi:hypothetical protein
LDNNPLVAFPLTLASTIGGGIINSALCGHFLGVFDSNERLLTIAIAFVAMNYVRQAQRLMEDKNLFTVLGIAAAFVRTFGTVAGFNHATTHFGHLMPISFAMGVIGGRKVGKKWKEREKEEEGRKERKEKEETKKKRTVKRTLISLDIGCGGAILCYVLYRAYSSQRGTAIGLADAENGA